MTAEARKFSLKHLIPLLFCLFSLQLAAQDEHASHAASQATDSTAAAHTSDAHAADSHSAAFDPGKMIVDHITDTHDWHLWGHTHVPLPVILYTPSGFECFSSGVFKNHETHASQAHTGKHHTYVLEDEKILVLGVNGEVDPTLSASIIDVSITKNVLTIFIVSAIMLLVFLSVARAYTRKPGQAPKGLQSFMEPLIIFVRDDIAKPSIGPKYEKFMPYLLTVFFFIWIANLLGLVPVIPGGANMTGNIAVTFSLAVLTFIITTVNGNGHYWRHILAMPGVPVWALVLLSPIEVLGMFLRPFVLMIRLFANISAGHIIALAFFSLIFIFGDGGKSVGGGLGVGVASWLFTTFMMCLELLIAFLQAYVFTLLSAIYFGSAVEDHHHEAHASHS
ncbi:MAG: F0F1 ATP synthase subunit A [Bacteroidia bacterium]|nr:F0F1 ATP synthase subunit A [Bacteroidia bacterium]MCC6768332.1 F0F1 ATP synthase subunit A [Bacteroidia bacterium]